MNKKLGHDAIYDARELGVPRMLLLGLQHMFAMFGATVLVPILVQGYGLPLSIQTTLLFAGLGTLLFHLCTKLKVPAFLGSSFAFLGGFEAVASLDVGKFAGMSGEEKLPYALGGIVVAGALYLILALLFLLPAGCGKQATTVSPSTPTPAETVTASGTAGTALRNSQQCGNQAQFPYCKAHQSLWRGHGHCSDQRTQGPCPVRGMPEAGKAAVRNHVSGFLR